MKLPPSKTLMVFSIFVLTIVIYANSLGNSFHYDDSHSILENTHIRDLSNLPQFFTDPKTFSSETAMAMYRPFLVTTFAVNYAAGGYEPWGYHLVNIGLHALAAILLALLLNRCFSDRWLGFWGGLLFSSHPIQTQAINYVSSRSVTLSAAGVLLAIVMVSPGCRRSWPVAAYATALFSKSTAVVLMPLLVILRRANAMQLRHYLPFALITGLYLLIIWNNDYVPKSLAQDLRPLGAQWATQTKAVVYYVKLVFMPTSQSVEHTFRVSQGFGEATVVWALLLLASISVLVFRRPIKRSPASSGTLWFLVCLVPTFVIPLNVLVSEQRVYLAAVGVVFAILGTIWLCENRNKLLVPGLVLLGVWSVSSIQRNSVWTDEYTLWSDAVDKGPDMFRAQSNLGLAQINRGEPMAAVKTLRHALALNPRYGKTWSNLGLALEATGDLTGAESAFRMAAGLDPYLAGARNNLGSLMSGQGKLDEALEELRKALKIDSTYVLAHVNIGLVHHLRGDLNSAVTAYHNALRLAPTDVETLNNLALVLADMGLTQDAITKLRRTLQVDPDYEIGRVNLRALELEAQGSVPLQVHLTLVAEFPHRGDLWMKLAGLQGRNNQWGEAAISLESALKVNPESSAVMGRLASAYRHCGKLDKAIELYEQALSKDPLNLGLYDNLASAYAAVGMVDRAIDMSVRALEISPSHERARRNLRILRQPESDGL